MATDRNIPRIASYHCGPYMAAILQDPGTLHGSGCNAQDTGEVGVLNGDPTADICKAALEANAIPLSAYLPLNAVPWYDATKHRSNALMRKGAAYNRSLILEYSIRLVLLLGKDAWRSKPFLNLSPEVEIRKLPHPGRLGLLHYRDNGERIGAEAARRRRLEGFALPR